MSKYHSQLGPRSRAVWCTSAGVPAALDSVVVCLIVFVTNAQHPFGVVVHKPSPPALRSPGVRQHRLVPSAKQGWERGAWPWAAPCSVHGAEPARSRCTLLCCAFGLGCVSGKTASKGLIVAGFGENWPFRIVVRGTQWWEALIEMGGVVLCP